MSIEHISDSTQLVGNYSERGEVHFIYFSKAEGEEVET